MDARHHPFDVLSGSALGLVVAWLSYRQYFPPISETWRKGRAYPIRSWGRQPEPPRNHTFLSDDDVQPLRQRSDTDIESQAAVSGFSAQAGPEGANRDASANVFRQQISQSQRRRQQEGPPFAMQPSDTMQSTLSGKVSRYQNQMPAASPYAGGPRRHDTYDYSSSEEDSSYELQQTYNRSEPPRDPAYNPVQGTFTDTGYNPPSGRSPVPTPPPADPNGPRPFQTTGDIGDSRTPPPAVPTHAPGTTS